MNPAGEVYCLPTEAGSPEERPVGVGRGAGAPEEVRERKGRRRAAVYPLLMRLHELVETSRRVEENRRRRAKIELLAALPNVFKSHRDTVDRRHRARHQHIYNLTVLEQVTPSSARFPG